MNSKFSRKDKAKEIYDKVVNNVQKIINDGEYEKYLKFQKNFTQYSFNNRILIYGQFPNATKVAGKEAWRNVGREVIAPEHAHPIQIIAGMPKTGKRKVKKLKDGEEVEENVTYHYTAFKTVYVYDISETIGEPIPLEKKTIDSDNMVDFYEKLKIFSKYPIIERELDGNCLGFFDSIRNEITIEKNLHTDSKVTTLLHELVHGLYDKFDYKKDKNLSEIFVESIAFIVSDYFGLDNSAFSFNYITDYSKGNPKVIVELGPKIQDCAQKLIEDIEKFEMQELELAA